MVAPEQHLYQTIVLPRKLATGSIHDYQSVIFDGHLSDPLPVNIGVPQGSILRPLTFPSLPK